MSKKKDNTRCAIEFQGINKTIEIVKAVKIKSPKKFIYIEEIKEGSNEFRIAWTDNIFDELRDIEAFKIIRK